MSAESIQDFTLTKAELKEFFKYRLKSVYILFFGFLLVSVLPLLSWWSIYKRTGQNDFASIFLFAFILGMVVNLFKSLRIMPKLADTNMRYQAAHVENGVISHVLYPEGNPSTKTQFFAYSYLDKLSETPNLFYVTCKTLKKGVPAESLIIPKRLLNDEAGKAYFALLRERIELAV